MQDNEVAASEYGVAEVAKQLHGRLQSYLEAQYHIRDVGLIREREALLREAGTISQEPYIETTPSYETSEPYDQLGLPKEVGETLAELARWNPGLGVYPQPFVHQAEALRAFFCDGRDLIISTGTGSGKTEAFLFTILGSLVQEGSSRQESYVRHGLRALLLYPMNALVSDQLSRLRSLFGDERLAGLFDDRYGRHPLFGMYTSRTPYAGRRRSDRDQSDIKPILDYYLGLGGSPEGQRLAEELRSRGRWPAKDLTRFYGEPGGRWANRLETQPADRELLTRHEIQAQCPDILVTNYSMLEYMLMRPIERPVFQQTREWLENDLRNQIILVLDEAHMYRGTAGAEVGLLIRRLRSRLGISSDRMRCILTSASLGDDNASLAVTRQFASDLTGHPKTDQHPFTSIVGARIERAHAPIATLGVARDLAKFDLEAFYVRGTDAAGAVNSIVHLARTLGWELPAWYKSSDGSQLDTLRPYLYSRLSEYGPLRNLSEATSGHATSFSRLAEFLFPDASTTLRERATDVLLALGTFAQRDGRPLLPTRVHLFFRGLPSVYACANPRCTERRDSPGEEGLLGRLYLEPRSHCMCDPHARVYELYTHRDCGAAFLRVFGRGSRADFYWHENASWTPLEESGDALVETYLFLGEPSPEAMDQVRPVWLDLATGRVSATQGNPEVSRLVYRPSPDKCNSRTDNGQAIVTFQHCPACMRGSVDKIMDLSTKGEQPFATLVETQFGLQLPSRPADRSHPNSGRKVLLFSDGRQKAARLARDLPRAVEFDSFRQALALASNRLVLMGREPSLDHRRLYPAFVSVCADQNLWFFDNEDGSQAKLIDHVERFRKDYDADLAAALDEDWDFTPPLAYKRALLRQLCHPYYSLSSACLGVIEPTRRSLQRVRDNLLSSYSGLLAEDLQQLVGAWIQLLLEHTAYDEEITDRIRLDVDPYYHGMRSERIPGRFARILAACPGMGAGGAASSALYRVLTADRAGYAFLQPARLRLSLRLDQQWYQCEKCGSTQLWHLFGVCQACGSSVKQLAVDAPYMRARKGYLLEPVRDVLRGKRIQHISVEEHSAQLSQRDRGVVYATTEEYELRFQDVMLGQAKPPVDILSCTTTMEVGIDIGSLTGIGLRNVPPQRENYQQRAGRAGRRGASLSSVVTFAQDGPHDHHYYSKPWEIISGPPRAPKIDIGNARLARRHIHSHLIQTFFHSQLDLLPAGEQGELESQRATLDSSLGTVQEFFAKDGPFTLATFAEWTTREVLGRQSTLAAEIAGWLPDEMQSTGVSAEEANEVAFVQTVARELVDSLQEMRESYRPRLQHTVPGNGQEEIDDSGAGFLIELLFERGILPTYAFPTDLCTFYVFDTDGAQYRSKIKERVQQAKDRALSEYAPGRLLVVDKKTYRSGGIYVERTGSARPARSLFTGDHALGTYVYCPVCTYVRLSPIAEGERCPICSAALEKAKTLDPPGFSPERGAPLSENDREQETSSATEAQLPLPVEPDTLAWDALSMTTSTAFMRDRRLVVVNRGPDRRGFRVCESCGYTQPGILSNPREHERPFKVERTTLAREGLTHLCTGPLHDELLYLAHSFPTDLLLLRVGLGRELVFDPRLPWFKDAFRSCAEALALAAVRRLDLDPGELSSGFRLIPPVAGDPWRGYVEIYLYDTASGGAGYATEAGSVIEDVLDASLDLVRSCPEQCETSCTRCLRHYGNRFWHEHLDRRLAEQILTYMRSGQLPQVASYDVQCKQLYSLRRYLELEGWTVSASTDGGQSSMLLSVRPPQSMESARVPSPELLTIGAHPALLDPVYARSVYPAGLYRGHGRLVLIEDYLLTRDLPAAYLSLLDRIR